MRVEKALRCSISVHLNDFVVLVVKHHDPVVSLVQNIIEKLLRICSKLGNFIARLEIAHEIGDGKRGMTRELLYVQVTAVNALAT